MKNIVIVKGDKGSGKSLIAQDFMICRSFGAKWLGRYDVPKGKILLVDCENEGLREKLSEVFSARIGDFSRQNENEGEILSLHERPLRLNLDLLEQIWKQDQWLIIDPLWKMEEMMDLLDESDSSPYNFFKTLNEMADERNARVLVTIYPDDPHNLRFADLVELEDELTINKKPVYPSKRN